MRPFAKRCGWVVRGRATVIRGPAEGALPVSSSWCFSPVQTRRSTRPRAPTSGPSIRIQPFGRTCQSQLMTVPSPSAAKVSPPVVSIIELAVRELSRCGRSNPVSSTSISPPALPMRARNRVPSPIGSGVSNSTPVMAGLNDGSLRESAAVSNTRSTGAAMRIRPLTRAIAPGYFCPLPGSPEVLTRESRSASSGPPNSAERLPAEVQAPIRTALNCRDQVRPVRPAGPTVYQDRRAPRPATTASAPRDRSQ